MTNVSKKKLDPKIQKQLFTQLTELLASEGRKNIAPILSALFTRAEHIMFIKRLGIVCLLAQELSTYAIAKQLNVSHSTVLAIKAKFDEGQYEVIGTIIQKRTFKKEQFWKTLDVLLRAGLPPRGRGRWKWLYEHH